MRLRVATLLAAVIISAAVPLFSQDSREGETPADASGPTQPEDTDILLPSEILEVEDIEIELIEAPLPDFSELTLPDIAIPLPAPEELAITAAALEIDPAAPVAEIRPSETGERSLYSTGRVAVGSRNYLAGDIGVFWLGDDPSFNVQFSHESLDGFHDFSAGTGYFRRSDQISGELETGVGQFELNLDGAFEERDEGLQRQSSEFYSVDQRYVSGRTGLTWRSEGSFVARLGARIESATRLFVTDSGDPQTDSAVRAGGDIEAAFEFDRGDVGLLFDYDTRLEMDAEFDQVFDTRLRADVALNVPVVLDASVGVSWQADRSPIIPFEAGIQGTIDDVLNLELRGGFRPLRPSYTRLWREVPHLGLQGQVLADGSEWFGQAGMNWLATSTVTLDSTVSFSVAEDAVDISGYSQTESRSPVDQRDITQLKGVFSANWAPISWLRLGGGYTGRFIDRRAIDPVHQLDSEVEIGPADGSAGVIFSNALPFYDEPALPLLGITGYASVTDGVELSLSFDDLLAPARDVPRARVGARDSSDYPFIEPGFRATLAARLSL